jgi:hypothetical protein
MISKTGLEVKPSSKLSHHILQMMQTEILPGTIKRKLPDAIINKMYKNDDKNHIESFL